MPFESWFFSTAVESLETDHSFPGLILGMEHLAILLKDLCGMDDLFPLSNGLSTFISK